MSFHATPLPVALSTEDARTPSDSTETTASSTDASEEPLSDVHVTPLSLHHHDDEEEAAPAVQVLENLSLQAQELAELKTIMAQFIAQSRAEAREIPVDNRSLHSHQPTKDSDNDCTHTNSNTHGNLCYNFQQDAATLGKDPSKGRTIYGVGIHCEPVIAAFVCPPGVDTDVQRALVDAAIDVMGLPGPLRSDTGWEEVVQAFERHMLYIHKGTVLSPFRAPRDIFWRSTSRVQMATMTSKAMLVEKISELNEVQEMVFANCKGQFHSILHHAGWDTQSIEMWLFSGLLPRILEKTFDFYLQLLHHALTMTCSQPWPRVAFFLSFHARKLALIRTLAPTRLQCLLQNYTYLRDMAADQFASLAYHNALLSQMNDIVKPRVRCSHCRSTLHLGDTRCCPWKDETPNQAKRNSQRAAALMAKDRSLDVYAAAAQVRSSTPSTDG
jgi:hypothetical protein